MAAFALCACATDSGKKELSELQAQVRALRDENARLESRLERVELTHGLQMAPQVPLMRSAPVTQNTAPVSNTASGSSERTTLPALTVVKLKPKKESAPKVATRVDIVEPAPEVLESIKESAQAVSNERPDPVDQDIGEASFQRGVDALKTGNVEGGVQMLQQFAVESPKHSRADNALYFVGLGKMGLEDYDGASKAFEEGLQRYPAGDAVLDSMLKLAECRQRQSRAAEAKAVYQSIVSRFPGTAAATQAQVRLNRL